MLLREKRAIELLKPQKRHKVLEIGFGEGKLLKKLAPVVDQVVGVEPKEELVTSTRTRLKLENLELRNAVAENLPFDDAIFDQVVCSYSYHEFSDGRKALTEIWRVLKPLGRIVIIDPSKDNFVVRLFSRIAKSQQIRTFEELRKELLVTGFSDIVGEKYRTKLILGGMWLEGTKTEK